MNNNQVNAIVQRLGPMHQLREIYFTDWGELRLGLADARRLSKLRQVTTVTFESRSDINAAAQDYLRQEMPWCDIVFDDEL